MYHGVKYKIYLHYSSIAGWRGSVHSDARAWFISIAKVYRVSTLCQEIVNIDITSTQHLL